MKSSLILTLLISLLTLAQAPARKVKVLSYEELFEMADLVVIAMPTAVRDTQEKTVFPDIRQNEQPVPAVGMEADFEILLELKGVKEAKTFVLHYLRHSDQSGPNGPCLVSFDPARKNRYLLFLKREGDGRYVPASGQLDPVDSIEALSRVP